MNIQYNLKLKRSETQKFEIPDLKSSCLVLNSLEIRSDQKNFDIKISGKDTILSCSEALLYQSNSFDLSDKLSQIMDTDKITILIKNLCTAKDANNVNITLTFSYTKMTGSLIFNNIYSNMTSEGLSQILNDISHAGKNITRIIWTSPNKLSSIELTPQFTCEPQWLQPIKLIADSNNHITMDFYEDETYETDLINQLCYYTLTVPDNVEKLGIIIYGFAH